MHLRQRNQRLTDYQKLGEWPKEAKQLRYVAARIRKRQGLLFASGCEQKLLAVATTE